MAERKIPTIEELEAHSRDRAALYRLGEGLIRNRFLITIGVLLITGFMAWQALSIEMSTQL